MNRKLTGSATVGLSVFLISSLITAVLGYRQIDKLGYHTVWATNQSLPVGSLLTERHLYLKHVKKSEQHIEDKQRLLGKVLLVDKAAGSPLLSGEFRLPRNPTLSERVPDGTVLYTLTVSSGAIPVSQIHAGDRFDVLVKNGRSLRRAATNITMLGSMKASQPSRNTSRAQTSGNSRMTLVICVRPEDVYSLAAINPSDTVTLVLHHPETAGATSARISLPTPPQQRSVDVFSGLSKRTVTVTH